MNIEFLNKKYFWLLIFLFFLVFLFYKKQKKGFDFVFFDDLKNIFKNNNLKFYGKIFLLLAILFNFILLLANPNISNVEEKIKKNGIDIVIALDVSGSMLASDLKPNRLEAAKNVISNFIKNLKTDRVGLVVFAGKPFTSIPLTFDYNILLESISRLGVDTINQSKNGLNGTAIGDAILMSKTLFKAPKQEEVKEYKKREKVIILLTDGDANVGVDPKITALLAKKENIKIYTIGIGSKKGGYINNGLFIQKIPPLNEKDLKYIASKTNAKFFRAINNRVFNDIFQELSKLEKNDIKVEIKREYKQYYQNFLYTLIFLLTLFTFLMISKIEIRKQ